MTEKEPKKLGRPKKYFTKEEHDQAQKLYRQRWYNTNKEYVKENRDLVREKEKRHLRTNSGYFGIYSGNDMYIAYSKDCLLYTSPSPRDRQKSRMPSSA